MHTIESSPEFVARAYDLLERRLQVVRERLGRPMTYAEKVLFGHLDDPAGQDLTRGKSYLQVRPDRVAMQDATAQMALLQFISAGIPRVAAPTTVHCDHLIQARVGAASDLSAAERENEEVYAFLASASEKYGIGFWKPGAGIIHQVVLEQYAFPGGLMIGTDSHTPNAGGLGMFASGVGGADAVDVMADLPWEVKNPGLVGVHLTGVLNGWAAPKDVILYLCGVLTVKGGTNNVVEYFGPGVESISCTGKGTITNMGAELGATTSLFPYDTRMETYLRSTARGALADLANARRALLQADPEVARDPAKYFDRIVEIDLSKLEPHVVGPHTPDLARPVSKLAADVRAHGYVDQISVALVGSCTNSSYEDIERAASVAREARKHGAKVVVPFLVTPGSEQVHQTIRRDGQMADLEAVGATVLANACGPCIGQWKRDDLEPGEKNSILTSFNRNFPARNDGNAQTEAFIGSPEIVVAYGLAGRLSVDPTKDELTSPSGARFRLAPPPPAPEVPPKGFVSVESGYVRPADDGSRVEVRVRPGSERLQILEPFAPWDGKDFLGCPVLLRAKGKCTTDHISPAGKWLRYRGHLDRISDNMFTGAVNAFGEAPGTGYDQLTGDAGKPIPAIARGYKAAGKRWVAVGDDNYGEGSSREHAAMSPRFLGAAAVLTRSFARIHESNLKKQGILPLTFADPADYDRIEKADTVDLLGLADLAPGREVRGRIRHADGRTEEIVLRHTLNEEQILWFRAGSALNRMRERLAR